MAARKMTFSLPAGLAQKFIRQVPSRQRSPYLARVLEQSLKRREADLIRACQAANQDRRIQAVERDMDAVADRIGEPWDDSAAR